ncbi:MAG: hypothetical protein ACI81L_002881 [Verrucomicrobiales bacterium]|jgi:hypothetical protein
MIDGELPNRENQRGGPGWWLDLDGTWRAPTEWPEDSPPIEGWTRESDGGWKPPGGETAERIDRLHMPMTLVDAPREEETRPSRQAAADKKATLSVSGALGAAALLLVGALVLITQASAEEDGVISTEVLPSVIYAADTDQVRMQRRKEAAAAAPDQAIEDLAALAVRETEAPTDTPLGPFDELAWAILTEDCLDLAENVLITRSSVPIVWADQLECVPDQGRWTDRYLGTVISRTIDAAVSPHIPPAIVFVSGGSTWTELTRDAYLTDTTHPATLQITSAGSGHNPRGQDPSRWKPSNAESWCAYAVDWVAVKVRWELDVTVAERDAVAEMLGTCGTSASTGADPMTAAIDPFASPAIERITGE